MSPPQGIAANLELNLDLTDTQSSHHIYSYPQSLAVTPGTQGTHGMLTSIQPAGFSTIGTEQDLNLLPACRPPAVDLDPFAVRCSDETLEQHVPLSLGQPQGAKWQNAQEQALQGAGAGAQGGEDPELESLEGKLKLISMNRSLSAMKCEQFLGYLEEQQRRQVPANGEDTCGNEFQRDGFVSSRRRHPKVVPSVCERFGGIPTSRCQRPATVDQIDATCETERCTLGRRGAIRSGPVGFSEGSLKEPRGGWAQPDDAAAAMPDQCPLDLTPSNNKVTMLENDWSYYLSSRELPSASPRRKSLSNGSPGHRYQRTPRGRHRRTSHDMWSRVSPDEDGALVDDSSSRRGSPFNGPPIGPLLSKEFIEEGSGSPSRHGGSRRSGDDGSHRSRGSCGRHPPAQPMKHFLCSGSSEEESRVDDVVSVELTVTHSRSGRQETTTMHYAGQLSRFSPSQMVPLDPCGSAVLGF